MNENEAKEGKWWTRQEKDRFDDTHTIVNWSRIAKTGIGVLVVALLLVFANPISCVGKTERGVRTLFGAVVGDDSNVLMPGVILRMPIVGGVVTRSITPNETKIDIMWDENGAVSSDTQMIGATIRVFWRYDENKISTIVKNFQLSDIDRRITMSAVEQAKAVIGQYTVFELGKNMNDISSKSLSNLKSRLESLPVEFIDLNVADFDWSPEVDKIVEQTITAQQAVVKARADADRAEEEQRRLSIEAEAQARAAVALSEGRLAAAKNDAEAKRAEGQGIADYNRMVSANMAQEIQFRQLEIELERAKKWNGVEVSTYLPLAANGTVVQLPTN